MTAAEPEAVQLVHNHRTSAVCQSIGLDTGCRLQPQACRQQCTTTVDTFLSEISECCHLACASLALDLFATLKPTTMRPYRCTLRNVRTIVPHQIWAAVRVSMMVREVNEGLQRIRRDV